MTVATWRTLSNLRWTGGMVLARWPDRQHLGVIAEDRRTSGPPREWGEGPGTSVLRGYPAGRTAPLTPRST
ncbi:MAG TPA: hypothetical protein VHZ03_37070 [Trebonia sp.]|nr:hypothetical protein [Trebonia sp.]